MRGGDRARAPTLVGTPSRRPTVTAARKPGAGPDGRGSDSRRDRPGEALALRPWPSGHWADRRSIVDLLAGPDDGDLLLSRVRPDDVLPPTTTALDALGPWRDLWTAPPPAGATFGPLTDRMRFGLDAVERLRTWIRVLAPATVVAGVRSDPDSSRTAALAALARA